MKRKKNRRMLLLLGILIFVVAFYLFSERGDIHRSADQSENWELILVNEKNRVPNNYEFELTRLSNGEQVDSRIYPDLQKMFDDARASGLRLFVRDGYRSREEQQEILDEKREAYVSEGYSKATAKKKALKWVAGPGTSEHEIGIAVDINADAQSSSGEELYLWLEDNSYRYGFVKRYPSDKTQITGVNNEPWHYRYVGKEAAKTMYEKGWCLEEYLENTEKVSLALIALLY